MTFYNWIKIIHILSAALLFGTGLGTAIFMYRAHHDKDIEVIALAYKKVVWADWFFTASSGVLQLLTGLTMVFYLRFPFSFFWIWGSLLGYIVAGICWLPVVFLQMKLRDITDYAWRYKVPIDSKYSIYFRAWFWLGWPAFLGLIIVFYLMVARPLTL